MNGILWNSSQTGRGTSCTESIGTTLLLLTTFLILVVLGTDGTAQEIGQTTPANDLPAEFKILWGTDPEADYQWTLVGKNEKAGEQEKLHPELNALQMIWHLPVAQNKNLFKFEFARPIRKGNNVFHLYVKADGDENTGRKQAGVHTGVDYMFNLIEGDPNHPSTGLGVFEADGGSRRGTCMVLIRDKTLYLAAEMTLKQQDGHSRFEYSISSYVKEGPSAGLGYRLATSAEAPNVSETELLTNPDMVVVNGSVPGWHLLRGREPMQAVPTADKTDDAVVLENLYGPEGLAQTVNLTPGHYLLRALAKTNVFQVHLIADRTRLPVAVSDDYKWVELPFSVPTSPDNASKTALVGFRYLARPASGNASRLPAKLWVKKVELVRLGDTALTADWATTLPVDPLHRLKLLQDSPSWDRPGKVVFQDTFLGTELWLMTQEGKIDHTYVGHPDFSHDGRYLHFGFRRSPRGLLRTDGSARYPNNAWKGLMWLFPWEQKRLPQGTDPAEWIAVSRTPEGIQLHNVATEEDLLIDLPARPGWQIVHFPGIASYGGRGPRIQGITHDTLVWLSEDNRSLGRSSADGKGFTTFPVRSTSSEPNKDTLSPSMSSVGGKSGDNWRDAIDRDGNRYFFFELNRDNLPNHPTNPYQVWALPLKLDDKRGPLRVVSHPNASVTGYVTSQTGMRKQPSAKWWDFAAGYPWSGDNAILRLEDDTLVHMSSLGMHSSFAGGNTVSVNCVYTGEIRYVGTYPMFDRVTWPHEFRRDHDYAVVASHSEPATPLVMIDLEHTTMWTLALTNFHDYAMRYKTRWNKEAYHKPMFRPAPTFSPDFTKVIYFSAMLTGDHPDRKWGDVYVAVSRYPEPPVNLRREGDTLAWDKPRHHAEIRGFRLYHSNESGQNYERVSDELLTETQCPLPPGANGFYVLTSVEYSGLEGRTFSNELNVGNNKIFRRYYRPATGKIACPMMPCFDPAGTGDGYAVAITDPDLIYKQRLEEGLRGSVTVPVAIPNEGPVRIFARVRGLTDLQRATYMTSRPSPGESATGTFTVVIGEKKLGSIPVKDASWHWVALDAGAVPLAAGQIPLEISTSDAGIAVENILVTNDPDFAPHGRGQVPEKLAAVPEGLRADPVTRGTSVKLAWQPVTAPQGVSHYNVYRSDRKEFEAEPETLLSSPSEPEYCDVGLQAGQTVYYRVRAVDAWGNQSPASAALSVTVK